MRNTTNQPNKATGRWIIALVIIFVLLVVGGATYVVVNLRAQSQPEAASTPTPAPTHDPKQMGTPLQHGGADCAVPKFMDSGVHNIDGLDADDCQYAQYLDSDGNYTVIPSYDGGQIDSADTSNNPQTPPTFNNDGVCNTPLNWYQWFNCGSKAQIAQRKADLKSEEANTGIKLVDAEKWAADPQLRNAVTLNIQQYGTCHSDAQSFEIAGKLVGNTIANQLEIVHHPLNVLINTSRLSNGQLGAFRDGSCFVRVSLAPIYYVPVTKVPLRVDAAGHTYKYLWKNVPFVVKGAQAGVFVDCFNIWWISVTVWHCDNAACHPPHENPRCIYDANLPPDSPLCFAPKSSNAADYLYPSGKKKVGQGGGGESSDDGASKGDGSLPGGELDGGGGDGSGLDSLGGSGNASDPGSN